MNTIVKNNRVEFLDERFYTEDGVVFYPSVTTVLECYPKGWGYQEWLRTTGLNSKQIMMAAGERGTNVHEACETLAQGFDITWDGQYSLEEWLMINRFVEFVKNHKVNFLYLEQNLVSHGLRVGGTMDAICKIYGEIWLIDYKTSSGIYNSYHVQIAAYKAMAEERLDMKIDRCGILWLDARTRGSRAGKIQGEGWQLVENDDPAKWLEVYNHVRAIWDIENPVCKPKNMVYPDKLKL